MRRGMTQGATTGGNRRSPPLPPPDPALEHAPALLDPDRLAVLAASHLQPGDVDLTVREVRLRYLEYRPTRRLTVRAIASLTGPAGGSETRDFVATTGAERPEPTLHWYPVDPGLPALAHGPDEVIAAARTSGVDTVIDVFDTAARRRWERLAWVPARRAVLGSDDVVVKFHSCAAEAVAAFDRSQDAARAVDTARAVHLDRDRAAVVAPRVRGRTLERGDALRRVPEVATVLTKLHQSRADRLPRRGPDDLLAACEPVTELVQFARPDLAARIARVVARLAASIPAGLERVASHGDFNVGQLIERADGGLVVVDTDTLAAEARALDVAAYGTNLISGREGDLDAALESVDALVSEYRMRPDGLDWYLAACVLRRLDRPLRRAKRRWPERVERSLDALETLAAGVGVG